jgi:DNA-directed RNA polymerase specialized sigma24 family protein
MRKNLMEGLTPGLVSGLAIHELRDATTGTDRKAASLADTPSARYQSGEPLNGWLQRVVRELMRAEKARPQDAEDAAMKAITDMLRAVEPGNHSLAYVRRAAVHNFVKEKTRYGDRVRDRLDDPGHSHAVEGVADRRLDEWEGERWCEDVLSGLPPRQREVMESLAVGLGNQEIARKLGTSDDAVRRNRSDACKALRKILGRDGEYRQPAAPVAARGRSVSRTIDEAVAALTALADPDRDLRAMSLGQREETAARVEELRRVLLRCPAGAFGAEGSAVILAKVAAMATARISDRDERAALKLIRTASPHLAFVGHHPAAFDLERARAEALCELGYPKPAQSLLLGLSEKERQVFGADNPRTALLLLWARAMSGEFHAAEAGLRALEARVARSQGPGMPLLLWHVQCRRHWLRGRRGQVDESAGGYDRVILYRSHQLGSDDCDTLDGGHSKGKMLVVNGAGSQAITILRAVADDRARTQGDDHSDTLESVKYLHVAQVQAEPRDDRVRSSAIASLEEIQSKQASRHSQRHPMSRDTAAWLSSLRRLQDAIRSKSPQKIVRQ